MSMTLKQLLAMSISSHRKAKGWSQEQLGSMLQENGLDWEQPQVSRAEAGQLPAVEKLSTILILCEVFDLHFDTFFHVPNIRPEDTSEWLIELTEGVSIKHRGLIHAANGGFVMVDEVTEIL